MPVYYAGLELRVCELDCSLDAKIRLNLKNKKTK